MAVTVECNLPTHPDTTAVHVVLEPEAIERGGRLFVRVDSLRSGDGTRFDGDSGMLVQALVARGPAYGCATVSRVGAEVWAPGAALRRSWVHVKSNYPVRITLEGVDGTPLIHRLAFPGRAATPLEWSAR